MKRRFTATPYLFLAPALVLLGIFVVYPIIGQLASAAMDPPPPAATLIEALGREPSLEEVSVPILESLESAVGAPADPLCLDAELLDDVERLCVAYADDSWTWRR